MATKKGQAGAAGQYAKALLELANERKEAEPLAEELAGLKAVVQGNAGFAAFLTDPAVGRAKRRAALEKVFGGRVSALMLNGLRVLNEKGRLPLLPAISDDYRQMLDKQLGNVRVEVTVAQRLDDAMLASVQQRLSQAMKKNATVTQVVDEDIIAGMIVHVDDKLLDGSAKTPLEAMKRRLIAAAPK